MCLSFSVFFLFILKALLLADFSAKGSYQYLQIGLRNSSFEFFLRQCSWDSLLLESATA
jgi:hypothetical protein